MKKNLILMMLLLAGAVSATGQEAKMVVKGNMVNAGNVTATIPIELRATAGVTNTITNTEDATLLTTVSMEVGSNTKVDNAGFLCVGCAVGTLPPCKVPLIPNGITGKNGNPGSNEVFINQASLPYSVTNPIDGITYTWSSDDFILPEIKTGTSITVTAPAIAGTYTITVTPSDDCGGGPARDLPVIVSSYPYGTLFIPNAKTGFISGRHPDLPTTATSGDILLAAANALYTTRSWSQIANFPADGADYENDDANLFVGDNAGCADGWRMPSIVELIAIGNYFNDTYENNVGPSDLPGFTQLSITEFGGYISSTYARWNGAYGYVWLYHNVDRTTARHTNNVTLYRRCVLDL
jgi:hypothetical protein